MSRRKIKKDITNTEAEFEFTSFFGNKVKYNIVLLQRKKAAMTQITALRTVLAPLGKIDNIEGATFLKMVEGFDEAWSEAFWKLGETLLDQCLINDEEIDYEDYFGRKLPELCQAIAYALLLNYPDVFTQARLVLKRIVTKIKEFVVTYQPGGEKSTKKIIEILEKWVPTVEENIQETV
ncbi:MAG: hypothetical protein P8Z50_07365 [candidate division WOR-3 bacterium]|jgi:hypothetical protein